MKIFLLTFLSFSWLFSYSLNDKLKTEDLQSLSLQNKTAVISFFASWCDSCKKELPLLNSLSDELKDIQFIGVDVDEKHEDALKFQKHLKLKFSVINDLNQKLISSFSPVGFPAIYIVKNGMIVKEYFGYHSDIKDKITKFIAEK